MSFGPFSSPSVDSLSTEKSRKLSIRICNTNPKDVQTLKQRFHTYTTKGVMALGCIWRCRTLLLVLIGLGCDPPPPPDRLVSQGEVKQVIVHDQRVVIDHEPIPTLFPAKTSSFALRSPALLQQCTPGDRVRFTLERGEQTLYLVEIEKLDQTE